MGSLLPTYKVSVKNPVKGTYFTFEIEGDSMDDGTKYSICDGDKVTARKVEWHLWQNNKLHIHKERPNYIIHHKDGITLKQIIEHNINEGYIVCHSLNPNKDLYDDFKLPITEISQIFNVVKISRDN